MPRRTKIIATLGPASEDQDTLQSMLQQGVDLVRINLSHGTQKEQAERLLLAKSCAKNIQKIVGILVDLQGPKIRIARFKDAKGTELVEGGAFILDAECPVDAGDDTRVGLDYHPLPQEVSAGDELLLDDGRIVLTVDKVIGSAIHCRVLSGGTLTSNKGLNRKGGGLSAPSLTEKDQEDIKFLADLPVDYVALSFPRGKEDIEAARKLLIAAGSHAKIVAKIERAEAITNIDEIIEASDAVMVARGDLGVEIGFAELPGVQKYIIHRARQLDKAVITATQMMESMITNSIPTRAEVSDVANAILDGTDAVMLSAETATGAYPVKVITIMDEICRASEKRRSDRLDASGQEGVNGIERHDKAIAMAAMYVANHVSIKAIVALTESGSTPLWMSRVRSGIPIYSLSRHELTCGRVTLFRGVYPVNFDVTQHKPWEISRRALDTLVMQGILETGDKVIVTKGEVMGIGGKTNGLKILTV